MQASERRGRIHGSKTSKVFEGPQGPIAISPDAFVIYPDGPAWVCATGWEEIAQPERERRLPSLEQAVAAIIAAYAEAPRRPG